MEKDAAIAERHGVVGTRLGGCVLLHADGQPRAGAGGHPRRRRCVGVQQLRRPHVPAGSDVSGSGFRRRRQAGQQGHVRKTPTRIATP